MYTTRRPPGPTRTRARVLTAVRELLEAGTFHELTVEEIAQHAGVSRASLYQTFGSRLGLVDAVCDTFAKNPALVALRTTTDLELFCERVVEFWSSEEKVLVQLYGAAAVDPAAAALVERQRRDRYGELRRILGHHALEDRDAFATLAALTSFETYRELRRHAGLPRREVVRLLQVAASRLSAPRPDHRA
jgi:AcrR family transcriptional regulator